MATLPFLTNSAAVWKARHSYRQGQLELWSRRLSNRHKKWEQYKQSKPTGDPLRSKWYELYQQADDKVDKWEGSRDQASYWLKRRRGEIAAKRSKVSANFDISEFDCRDGTKVPVKSTTAVSQLCRDVLEPMRKRFGDCHVLSGYRHASYNRKIGGATMSYHIYDIHPGDAASDVIFASGGPAQWAAFAKRLGKGGVGQYDQSGFVHVDNGPIRFWSG